MKVLVTGGAGFIGSHIVDALVERGDYVVIADSLAEEVHPHGLPSYVNPAAQFELGNLANESFCERVVKGVDVVIHCAARLGLQRSFDKMPLFVEENVLGTANLLQASTIAGVRRIVVSSSMGVYGEGVYECEASRIKIPAYHPGARSAAQLSARRWEHECPDCGGPMRASFTTEATNVAPTSIYSLTKLDQESLALLTGRATGMGVSVLRYFNAYGPRQTLSNPYSGVGAIFANALLNGQPCTLFEDGQQTRDLVYVSDIVNANLLAMECEQPQVIANIGTGQATTIERLAQEFALAVSAQMSLKCLPPTITQTGRIGDIRHSKADISVAQRDLWYEPRVSLADGVRQTVAWIAES